MEKNSVDYYLRKAARRGLLVNNLFQIYDHTWQANFRSKDDFTFMEFGRGETPQAALKAALNASVFITSKKTNKRTRNKLANIRKPIATPIRKRRRLKDIVQ